MQSKTKVRYPFTPAIMMRIRKTEMRRTRSPHTELVGVQRAGSPLGKQLDSFLKMLNMKLSL